MGRPVLLQYLRNMQSCDEESELHPLGSIPDQWDMGSVPGQ